MYRRLAAQVSGVDAPSVSMLSVPRSEGHSAHKHTGYWVCGFLHRSVAWELIRGGGGLCRGMDFGATFEETDCVFVCFVMG